MSTNITQAKNKKTRRDQLRLILKGMQLHLLPKKTITIEQSDRNVADIMTLIENDIAASDAADKGHTDWRQLVAEERASHAVVDPLIHDVVQIVRVEFGNTDAAQSILGDFGLAPHKKGGPKPKVKVEAAVKAKATRTLLHTQGPKQKEAAKAQAAQEQPTASQPAAVPVVTNTPPQPKQ
jgi:hypothetical protein